MDYQVSRSVRKYRYNEDYASILHMLNGTGKLWEDKRFVMQSSPYRSWRRPRDFCDNPIFINGQPSRFDVLQGNLGMCWAAVAFELATLDRKCFKKVVPTDQNYSDKYVGAFHFRFWRLGYWYDVVVDDRLPVYNHNNTLAFTHSLSGDVFWGALLEKAYAKFCNEEDKDYSYDSIVSGYSMHSLQNLSGGIVEFVIIPFRSIKWLLNEIHTNGAWVTCSSEKADRGIVSWHSYAITNVYKAADDDPDYSGLYLVRIMNPWGKAEWRGHWSDEDCKMWWEIDRELRKKMGYVSREDGEFWMSEEDFEKYFSKMTVCHIGPGQYIESKRIDDKFKIWNAVTITGEWVKDITAAGSDLLTRYMNPQYLLKIESPDGRKDAYPVVMELSQWNKGGRSVRPPIAFYVYKLDKAMSTPLQQSYFQLNDPINGFPSFSNQIFLYSVNLIPGNYLLVPCTMEANEESQFLLRVFTQGRILIISAYDVKVSKSLPMEEDGRAAPDNVPAKLFYGVARGQGEVNWAGLKDILDNTLLTNTSLLSTIIAFLQSIFSPQSSNEEGNELRFSKDECRSIIAMLDSNQSGTLNFSEFSNLWAKIAFWKKVYALHKNDELGCVPRGQLRDALSAMGYNVPCRNVHSLSYLYANAQGNIFLKDFILCGITLETCINLCEKNNIKDGKVIFTLEEWLKNTLIL